jgi:uncharacterized protein (TIGR00369 family)
VPWRGLRSGHHERRFDRTDSLSAPNHDLFGYGLREWRDGYARLAAEAVRRHLNRAGVVHRGFVLGLIDQAAASFGLWCSVLGDARRGMTLALATQFATPVMAGPVVAEAREVGRGATTFFTRTEVFRADRTLVATGQGTHRVRSGRETVEGTPVAAMT